MDADVINGLLRSGATVTLQAQQELVIDEALDGTGGGLILQAGNNVRINQNITTNNGAISITSGDTGGATDGIGTDILMGSGVTVAAGSQTITLTSPGGIDWRA